MIDQATLKAFLHYDPGLGLFWWKERPNDKRFNANFAGRLAGVRLNTGYVQISIMGEKHQAHRLAWLYMTGQWPEEELDHRNTWKLDNAFENLREATRSQNCANRKTYAASGFKGVTITKYGRFVATISHIDGPEYLGSFSTAEEANAAYAARALELHGEFARAA